MNDKQVSLNELVSALEQLSFPGIPISEKLSLLFLIGWRTKEIREYNRYIIINFNS